jgi:hypothetical protein
MSRLTLTGVIACREKAAVTFLAQIRSMAWRHAPCDIFSHISIPGACAAAERCSTRLAEQGCSVWPGLRYDRMIMDPQADLDNASGAR